MQTAREDVSCKEIELLGGEMWVILHFFFLLFNYSFSVFRRFLSYFQTEFYFYTLERMPDLPRVFRLLVVFFLPAFFFEFILGLGNSLCVQNKTMS